MARWTVVRVAANDGPSAWEAIVEALAPVTMRIDMAPPAAAPEWEIAVQDVSALHLRAVLMRACVIVLALKTFLDEAMRAPGSNCCGALLRVESGSEGTSYAVCTACQRRQLADEHA